MIAQVYETQTDLMFLMGNSKVIVPKGSEAAVSRRRPGTYYLLAWDGITDEEEDYRRRHGFVLAAHEVQPRKK